MAMIVGRTGQYAGMATPVAQGGVVLGRGRPGADRVAFAEDSDISREHCLVQYDPFTRRFKLTELGSSNGTFLLPEERRIANHQKVECGGGQLIRLGRHNSFELVADPPAQRPPREPELPVAAELQRPRRETELPRLPEGARLDLKSIRVPYERFYFVFVCIAAALATVAMVSFLFMDKSLSVWHWLIVAAVLVMATWISWRLLVSTWLGNAIKVGPSQYPQIDTLVTSACAVLGIETPTVLILQGHGVFEIYVARHFSRRGFLLITSTMLDDLTESGSSRELMFFIGRQLGLIADGYFDYWFFKHTLGQLAGFFYLGWKRRCQLTADRLGLLVTGELQAAEHAMLVITAGSSVAANTNIQAIKEQRTDLMDSWWSWIALGLASYPFLVDRIIRLREFAGEAAKQGIESNEPVTVGALPINHHPIRALPLMIVHGHDRSARVELENFLLRKFPHVQPVLMISETDAASTLPEKFERLARGVKGALVLLTPDDLAMARSDQVARSRARQNVIFEIGWISARFGRQRLLLLTQGDLEIPSDLSGVEVHRYANSPVECSEVVRDFISTIQAR